MSGERPPAPAWHEVAPRPGAPSAGLDAASVHPGRVFLRTTIPGGLVAVLLTLLGRELAAAVVLVVAVLVGVGAASSPRFRRGFDRLLHAVGHSVGVALSFLLMGLLELFIFLPVSLLLRLVRHDPLKPGADHRQARWQTHPGLVLPGEARSGEARSGKARSGKALDRHLYVAEPAKPVPTGWRRQARQVPRLVGFVAIVLALDLAVGWVWQTVGDSVADRDLSADQQFAAATADAEWFPAYQDEMAALEYEFAPFVLTSVDDVSGRYVNISGGLRETYTPDEPPPDPVTVQVFGGTNVWGDGQRDGHTIPSELARLAEDEGMAVRVVNHGQLGDVNFGAVLRFERALASAPAPDLVVFADGPDDYAVQIETPSADPGQYGQTDVIEELAQPVDDRSLWDRYVEVSLLQRAVSRVTVLFSAQPAHATSVTEPVDDLATRTAAVYERGRLLASEVAARRDV